MKTRIFVPNFYLATKDQLLRIDRPMTIGRSDADFVFEDDNLLSSKHCEIRTLLLEAFIIDLNSQNGVFINKTKIYPNVEVKLNPGDLVLIGSQEYTFYDNEEEAKRSQPPLSRRKFPRPDNLYGPKNLITFYAAQYSFRGLYLLILLATAGSVFFNMDLNFKVPQELSFLERIYYQDVLYSGIKLLFFVWLTCLAHGFLLAIYFNRNPIRKGVSLVAFSYAIYSMVDFQHGPLGGIKRYIIDRENLASLDASDKSIVNLKNIIKHKKIMAKSFEQSRRKVPEEHLAYLTKDYNAINARLDRKIATLDRDKKKKSPKRK